MRSGEYDGTYHILGLIGEKSNGARAIVLDLVLDQAHRGSRSPLTSEVIRGLRVLDAVARMVLSLGYLCLFLYKTKACTELAIGARNLVRFG